MTLLKETIHLEILEMIADHANKITSRDLEKMIIQRVSVGRRAFQTALKALIAEGELAYTYLYGCTFIEKSFNRPVRVGSRVILTPPERQPVLNGSDIAVVIRPGASFGCGQHPTTRLAIQGIEYALKTLRDGIPTTLLDIGTGSGVLAITALKLGIHLAMGTDMDPCAIAEAGENAQINGLSQRFTVLDVPAEEINAQFHLIAANLRYPTLARLCPYIASHIHENGAAILSGIREDEVQELKSIYAGLNLECRWEAMDNRWAGLVLSKRSLC
ncbi:MAG: 50S ribosomal protein L11 methyltransferase [Deltaproteobacteria bacterium]|nr:50S ribosomal protein L11 methyltransferase [Deltaproteobacteria bacterium]